MTSQSRDNTSLPTADEELAVHAQTGDQKAATELICRYRPFVKMIASHYFGASLETDDIVQEGLIGLLSAVYTYSSEKNAAFRTYCAACVTNSIRSAVKADAGKKNSPLNSYIPLSDVELPADFSPEQIVISDENTVFLNNLIDTRLSALENEVLKLHIGGADYRTTAETLGITEKAVDNALQRVRSKLSKALSDY
ncbi:MAG: sigma-70 family RNA polymerase sigma factor [Clostridia bacterium]|nr:sigma-70 family RNA polymerase sigma factor [Clostridia bacterium]